MKNLGYVRKALMDCSHEASNSNDRAGDLIPSELLRATKKVKNKDSESVEGEDHEMRESEPIKTSFKEVLMGNRSEGTGDDVCLPLLEEEEITLLEDDV